MAYTGDTIRLKVHFKSFDGVSIDPEDVTLTLYDVTLKQIEQIPLTGSDKEKVGVYFYDYVVPDDIHDYFIFEFRGLHNNKPILARDKVNIKFN